MLYLRESFSESLAGCLCVVVGSFVADNAFARKNRTVAYTAFFPVSHPFAVAPAVRANENRVLLYVYRPKKLEDDIKNEAARDILEKRGYQCEKPGMCVTRLMKLLREGGEFPHEIGLFLGYPPEYVEGFIENSHECKMSGFWKVYGDVHSAELLFNKYKKCTKVYCEQWKNGKTIERLTVKG